MTSLLVMSDIGLTLCKPESVPRTALSRVHTFKVQSTYLKSEEGIREFLSEFYRHILRERLSSRAKIENGSPADLLNRCEVVEAQRDC